MEYTIAIIKPNVIEQGLTGEVMSTIEKYFKSEKVKYIESASIDLVAEFYKEHRYKDFYKDLVNNMSNRPWLALQLVSRTYPETTISDWRTLMKTTIRPKYSLIESYDNAVHGSDSRESAEREYNIIFGEPKSSNYIKLYNGNSITKINKEHIVYTYVNGMKGEVILSNGHKINTSTEELRRINKILK